MKSRNVILLLLGIFLFIICCLCLIITISGAFFLINSSNETNFSQNPVNELFETIPYQQDSPNNNLDENPFSNENSDLTPSLLPEDLNKIQDTLEILKNSYIPENDPYDLARRLKGIEEIPLTVPNDVEFEVGDFKEFWKTNVDTNENSLINAKLGYKTENVYFWIEEGVSYDKNELSKLVTTFEKDIVPTNREFFGTEWTPGIDEDHRLYILYARNIGSGLAGYFSSADAVPPQVHEYSNAHEMFFLSADNIRLSQKFTYGVLAHEYQHMIHWFQDRNETSWLNEGFSELAAFLNGYYESGFDTLFLGNPDIQLNDWPNNPSNTTPHYGASFLFVNYFLNRFGEDATKALVKNPKNGLESIDEILFDFNAIDPRSNEIITADDLFNDWIITNLILDKKVDDGRFYYQNYSGARKVTITEKINECEFDWKDRSVHQYAADYIELNCNQNFTIHFQGNNTTKVIPQSAYSGDYSFWSNKGDESHMVLTQTFDFRQISEPIEMSYMAWYDIEKDYDYLYLTASIDGEKWDIINTPSCTTMNPSGNSYGCAYNGSSSGWISQTVDLSEYLGMEVEIRFEYVTDAAVNGEGFLLDDIQIPAINYFSDFETDNGGWDSLGWVRIQNLLPQTYKLILIEYKSGQVHINEISLNEKQEATIEINGKTNNKTYLIVAGTTRFTRQPAFYRFQVSK
ncbi:MAG TPA: hypothetical protein VK856_08590 [Anaerolineaceae bacterium]|nr:hypothetical protein [Anaerolineaceae bacterium]